MQGAYSEIYLDEAMRNMGEMIEYGEEACGVEQDLLLRMFIRSGYADRWEKGDPRIICGLSGTELCRRLIEEIKGRQILFPLSGMTQGNRIGGDLCWPIISGGVPELFQKFLQL